MSRPSQHSESFRKSPRRKTRPPLIQWVTDRSRLFCVGKTFVGASLAMLVVTSCTVPRQLYGPPYQVFGHSVEGRPIRGAVLGEGDETQLLIGVVHGNEPLGEPILLRLIETLKDQPELLRGSQVVIVPVVNPDGLAANTRTNSRGIDLNRNFPSNNWAKTTRHGTAPESEPETRIVVDLIKRFKPTRILSIHSPLDCVNYDGPADTLAKRIASVTPYPLRADIGYPTPGSLGSYAGNDLRLPTITLELGAEETIDGSWPRTRPGLFAFLNFHHGAGSTVLTADAPSHHDHAIAPKRDQMADHRESDTSLQAAR